MNTARPPDPERARQARGTEARASIAVPPTAPLGGTAAPRSKAWLLFVPLLLTVLQWRPPSPVQVNDVARDLGKGWLLLVTIGLCTVLLGHVTRFRITPQGRLYLAYTAFALVAAVIGPAWLAASFRSVRLGLTVVAVFLVLEVIDRSGGDAIEGYMKAVTFFVAVTLVEAVIFPDAAWRSAGFGTDLMRLQGVFPPLEPNAIAGLAGVVIVMGLVGAGLIRPKVWVPAVVICVAALVLSITRTPAASALAASLAGLVLGSRTNAISRRMLVGLLLVSLIVGLFASTGLMRWVRRDQPDELIYNVTGRTPSWVAVFSEHRETLETLFGEGLGAKTVQVEGPIGYLSINSSWLAAYQQTGLVGSALLAAIMLTGLAAAAKRSRDDQRGAVAFALLLYILLWSIPETGLDDTSPAIIHVLVASSFVVFGAFVRRNDSRIARRDDRAAV